MSPYLHQLKVTGTKDGFGAHQKLFIKVYQKLLWFEASNLLKDLPIAKKIKEA